jgi:hypothetical protein
MSFLKKSFSVISVLAVSASFLTMTGCGDKKDESSNNDIVYYTTAVVGGEDSKEETVSETALAEPDEIIDGFVGDTLESNGISATLEKIVITAEETSNNTMLLCAVFNIKNTTAEDLEVNFLSHFTVTADGEPVGMDSIASASAISMARKKVTDAEKFYTTIISGNTERGYMTFEIPNGTQEITVNYYPYNYKENNEFGFRYKATVSDLPVI